MLSAGSSALAPRLGKPGFAIATAFLAMVLFVGAVTVFVRRPANVEGETDRMPTSSDDGPRRTQ